MGRFIIIIPLILLTLYIKSQSLTNSRFYSLKFKPESYIKLIKTNVVFENQYSKEPQIFAASESIYSRFRFESGVILLGFLPIKIQGFYSTEKQNIFNENYFRVNFDLELLVQEQRNKAYEKYEHYNRKLIHQINDYENQKKSFKPLFKHNDSLIYGLQSKIKKILSDTIIKSKNKINEKLEDSIENKIDKIKKIEFKNDSIYKYKEKIDILNNKKDIYNFDSLKRVNEKKILKTTDSLLSEVDKLKRKNKNYEDLLKSKKDSVEKIKSEIKHLVDIIKNPKLKIKEIAGNKIKLPKNLKIGRINPYFSESVFNGTPSKGVYLEYGNDSTYTTISFGKLFTFPESNANSKYDNSEYFAYKYTRKKKFISTNFGLFNCIKEVIQGNRFYFIPFYNLAIFTSKGITLNSEIAKSFDYEFSQIENIPKSNINSGYLLNFYLKIPLKNQSGFKIITEKSSENYNSPGNPFFISGPLKIQLEYSQSFFKNKLKIDAGIRNNLNKNDISNFKSQTFILRANSNFNKNTNFSISYLPIQTRSEFIFIQQNERYLFQTNMLNIMIINKKRFKRYSLLQNFGYWTKSQNGLIPDFQSENFFYSLNYANSKNNKLSFIYNLGKNHQNSDSLNQSSFKLIAEGNLKKNSSLTLNCSYVKTNKLNIQHRYLVGIKQNLGVGLIWLEVGSLMTQNKDISLIGKLNMYINF